MWIMKQEPAVITAPEGDPGYIKNRDLYFLKIADAVASASTHPLTAGGAVISRDRDVIATGRSVLSASKVEIDPISYAIGSCCKLGTPTIGAVIYSTRYPFAVSVMQAHLMGIRRFGITAHEWETIHREEFRKAARLARELSIAIEPVYSTPDPRFAEDPHQLDQFDGAEP